MKKILALLLLLLAFNSCERDDICADTTQTTPSLIIRFYDISNQESNKNVFGLRVQGVGIDDVLEDYNVVTTDSIVLPLKTTETSTQFKLHQEYVYDNNGTPDDTSDDIISGNEDIITIAYATEEIYVSRACGFKTVFKNVTVNVEDDGDKWIQIIQSVNDNQSVEDETAAHFKIFH
mgnify:CR=1 FL=1